MKPVWRQSKPYKKEHGKRRTLDEMGYRDLKNKLDTEFSLFVRLSNADSNGVVRCVTCGAYHLWNDIHLGHYISRSHDSVRWDVRNTAPQCAHCNSFRGGEQYKMRAYLVNRYGESEIQAMEKWADMVKTENTDSLRMKIIEYREKVKMVKLEKGL